jgi:hypothetical protein
MVHICHLKFLYFNGCLLVISGDKVVLFRFLSDVILYFATKMIFYVFTGDILFNVLKVC